MEKQRIVSVRWILAALSLSVLLSSIGTSIANVSLPTLAQVFGASFQQVQWVVLAYLLAVTTMVGAFSTVAQGLGIHARRLDADEPGDGVGALEDRLPLADGQDRLRPRER